MFRALKDQFSMLIVSYMSRKLSVRISCMYCRSIFATVKIKKKTWTLEILILWFISVQIKRSKKTKLQWVMIISLWFYVTSEWLLLTIGGKMSKWNGGVYDFWICTFDFWFNFDLINSFARFLAGIPQQRLANYCDLTICLQLIAKTNFGNCMDF